VTVLAMERQGGKMLIRFLSAGAVSNGALKKAGAWVEAATVPEFRFRTGARGGSGEARCGGVRSRATPGRTAAVSPKLPPMWRHSGDTAALRHACSWFPPRPRLDWRTSAPIA
jgi:hypothetical protein